MYTIQEYDRLLQRVNLALLVYERSTSDDFKPEFEKRFRVLEVQILKDHGQVRSKLDPGMRLSSNSEQLFRAMKIWLATNRSFGGRHIIRICEEDAQKARAIFYK